VQATWNLAHGEYEENIPFMMKHRFGNKLQ